MRNFLFVTLAAPFRGPGAARLRALCAGVTGLVLASCAVGPDFVSPPVPEVSGYTPEPLKSPRTDSDGPRVAQQHFVTGAEISARWWAVFRSTPLNDLIRLSVEHNPSLQSAEAAIKVANFNALAQRGLFLPQLGANYSASDQQFSNPVTQNGPGNPSQLRYTLQTAQLNISFVPDIWGQNIGAVESLDALTEQAQFQLEAAYLALTANVVTAAIQEASLRGQIEATERIVKIERDILGILKNQFAAGQAAQVDVLTQETALAQAEQTLPPLQKHLAVQRNLLTALTTILRRRGAAEIRSAESHAPDQSAGQPAEHAGGAAARRPGGRGEPAFGERARRRCYRSKAAEPQHQRQSRHHRHHARSIVHAGDPVLHGRRKRIGHGVRRLHAVPPAEGGRSRA